jgi:hypothetical protein
VKISRAQNRSCALVVVMFVATIVSLSATANSQVTVSRGLIMLDGKLITSAGKPPVLKTAKQEYPLTATTTYVLHTLQDNRLGGREIQVQGTLGRGGTFEVSKFFTVRNGKLYRVRYYCETCNIVALEPGRCVCCQQPTELQEIPASSAEPDTVAVP